MASASSVPVALAFIVPFLVSGPASALTNDDAKVLLHLTARTLTQPCSGAQAHPACRDVVTSGGLYPTLYFAYLLVADGDPVEGIAGVQLGIGYDSGLIDGVGFDMDKARRLFEPFQRMHTSKEFPGTGIGLATVHRVLAKHGGGVWADSVRDQGSIFYFSVPKGSVFVPT